MEISDSEYKSLLDDSIKLRALEKAGVDNWDFYDDALKEYRKEKDREEKIETYFDELCEILCESIEEPAGSGCGFGFRDKGLEQASKRFREMILETI